MKPNRTKKPSAVQAWKMLLLSLPKGIAAFVAVVVGLSVSLPLSVFLIGLPLLAETLVIGSRLMQAERRTAKRWLLSGGQVSEEDAVTGGARQWNGWRELMGTLFRVNAYRGLLYGLLQFPIAIALFVVSIVLPVTAWAVMLSPLAHWVSAAWFDFNLFTYPDTAEKYLTSLTPDQRSWVAGGIGAVFVLLMPALLRALGKLYAGWLTAVAGPAETAAQPHAPAAPPEPVAPTPQYTL